MPDRADALLGSRVRRPSLIFFSQSWGFQGGLAQTGPWRATPAWVVPNPKGSEASLEEPQPSGAASY